MIVVLYYYLIDVTVARPWVEMGWITMCNLLLSCALCPGSLVAQRFRDCHDGDAEPEDGGPRTHAVDALDMHALSLVDMHVCVHFWCFIVDSCAAGRELAQRVGGRGGRSNPCAGQARV